MAPAVKLSYTVTFHVPVDVSQPVLQVPSWAWRRYHVVVVRFAGGSKLALLLEAIVVGLVNAASVLDCH